MVLVGWLESTLVKQRPLLVTPQNALVLFVVVCAGLLHCSVSFLKVATVLLCDLNPEQYLACSRYFLNIH